MSCPTLEQLQDVVRAVIILMEVEDETEGLSISMSTALSLLHEGVDDYPNPLGSYTDDCCLADHMTATPPWTCQCACHKKI
jgi:hypothetical protein